MGVASKGTDKENGMGRIDEWSAYRIFTVEKMLDNVSVSSGSDSGLV